MASVGCPVGFGEAEGSECGVAFGEFDVGLQLLCGDPALRLGRGLGGGKPLGLLAKGLVDRAFHLDPRRIGDSADGPERIAVQLTRCGPVYTESTNNWYALTSAGTRPAMIRQSLRYDGNQVQDTYELRLDGSLPTRDPRDRDPSVNGCR